MVAGSFLLLALFAVDCGTDTQVVCGADGNSYACEVVATQCAQVAVEAVGECGASTSGGETDGAAIVGDEICPDEGSSGGDTEGGTGDATDGPGSTDGASTDGATGDSATASTSGGTAITTGGTEGLVTQPEDCACRGHRRAPAALALWLACVPLLRRRRPPATADSCRR